MHHPERLSPTRPLRATQIRVIGYDAERFEETQITDLQAVPAFLQKWPVTWINVDGLGDATVITELGRMFNLHRLALEDVVHVHQRAKAEPYGEYYFLVARMPRPNQPGRTEQISFFFGEHYVITFQEHPGGDCLDPVRARIRSGWGRGRAVRPDYLVYALLDNIVDHYFPLTEQCGERLDDLEAIVTKGPLPEVPDHLAAAGRGQYPAA